MGLVELVVMGVGLAADAFAVAVCKGLGMRRVNYAHAAVIALFFGAFQALMPLAGWLLGASFADFVEPAEHWIAFALLAGVGSKMLWDAFSGHDARVVAAERIDIRELFVLAVATSIDALAVGVSFALLDVDIALAACVIGAVTFALSFAGVVVGNFFGARWERPATMAGGVVLIALGVKILIEHLS